MQGQGRGMPGRGLGRGGGPPRPPRGQLNTYSEVKVCVGPVPVDWPFPRVKDALFQTAQVDVVYVGKTAADGTVIASYRDGATAEAAARALTGKTLVSGGPAISASVVTQTATANRAQVGWMGGTDEADGGTMVNFSPTSSTWSPEGDVSLHDMLNAGADDGSIPGIPVEMRPLREIEDSRSQSGVSGDEGPVGSLVSRRAAAEPADAAWGRRLEDGSLLLPESRMNDICDQWQSLDRGVGTATVQFSPNGNVQIVQNMAPNN